MSDFNLFKSIMDVIISVLPTSPFKGVIKGMESEEVQQVLSYLNWFVPIKDIVVVLTGWLTAIGLYYIYVIVLRWIKAIK